jgi:hypothetical protein
LSGSETRAGHAEEKSSPRFFTALPWKTDVSRVERHRGIYGRAGATGVACAAAGFYVPATTNPLNRVGMQIHRRLPAAREAKAS